MQLRRALWLLPACLLATAAASSVPVLKRLAQEGAKRPPGDPTLVGMWKSIHAPESLVSPEAWANLLAGVPQSPLSDAEFVDIELGLMEQAFGGDLMGSLRKMLLSFNVVFDLWEDTDVFRTILEGVPLLRALKGVDELFQKDKALLTKEDTRTGVTLFYNFIIKAMDAVDTVRDPVKFADKLTQLAKSEDPQFLALAARVEQGDEAANVELQKLLVARELGDIIDLDELGFNGIEPGWLKEKRDLSIADEAGFWTKIVDDPVARKYMEDPGLAYREFVNGAFN